VVGLRPPHIHLDVRSSQSRLVTQMLFPGEALNQQDRITAHANQAALTAAELGMGTTGARRLGWDIVLDLA
jgi:protocatechuate 3,4-dioxygenase beta subunit